MTTTRDIPYDVDGVTMVGRLALPDGDGMRPGVLIAHEGNGLDDFQKSKAEQYAALGYVAFALDYHGGGQAGTDRATINARMDWLTAEPGRAQAVAQAGLDVLCNEPRVDRAKLAATGYCFGGTLVLELARGGVDLKAVVGFHPGLTTDRPEASRNITGKVLVCIGADDPFVSPEQRGAFEQEMRAAEVDWQMDLYGGVKHSFTHPRAADWVLPGIEYNEAADRRSWRAMRDLLDEVFA